MVHQAPRRGIRTAAVLKGNVASRMKSLSSICSHGNPPMFLEREPRVIAPLKPYCYGKTLIRTLMHTRSIYPSSQIEAETC